MLSTQSRSVRRFVNWFNAGILAWRSSARWGGPVRRHIAIFSYTGRRSGRHFTIPVGFRRAGDTVTLGAELPDAKSWWRNFLGDGAPATIELDGAERSGHAVARRDEHGRVTVTVQLEPVGAAPAVQTE